MSDCTDEDAACHMTIRMLTADKPARGTDIVHTFAHGLVAVDLKKVAQLQGEGPRVAAGVAEVLAASHLSEAQRVGNAGAGTKRSRRIELTGQQPAKLGWSWCQMSEMEGCFVDVPYARSMVCPLPLVTDHRSSRYPTTLKLPRIRSNNRGLIPISSLWAFSERRS